MNKDLLNNLKQKIELGKALIFTGAGFSKNCTGFNERKPLLANDLAKLICEKGNFSNGNLSYAAERYIDEKGPEELISILKDCFTLTHTTDYIQKIVNLPWNKFYTTNYDNAIEFACSQKGKRVNSIDTSTKLADTERNTPFILHINGYIGNLTSKTLQSSFKLSDSSYLAPENFLSTPWKNIFEKDCLHSSAIVFIGYSLYDFEIKKLLSFHSERIKDKTYFITTSLKDKDDERYTLSKFGHILEIEAEGFANYITETDWNEYTTAGLTAFTPYESKTEHRLATDEDRKDLFIFGHIKDDILEDSLTSNNNKQKYIINRTNRFIPHIRNNIVITSDLGNGKSVLLRELMMLLSLTHDAFFLENSEADFSQDLSIIAKRESPVLLFIDNYDESLNFFDILPLYKRKNLFVITTARTTTHARYKKKLEEKEFQYVEHNINLLTDCEIIEFIDIIDQVAGFSEIGTTKQQKMNHIQRKCHKQISSVLISLFNSQTIKSRIMKVLDPILKNEKHKNTIFGISFLNILFPKVNTSLVTLITQDNTVYESVFRNLLAVDQLFSINENGDITGKSSLFSRYIITTYFTPDEIFNKLLQIAEIMGSPDKRNFSREYECIHKATLRFSFIERLFPPQDKKINLASYYDRLKQAISKIEVTPHYWLQYGMAQIARKDFLLAEKYLKHANNLGKKLLNYNTDYINTQWGRLCLLKAQRETSIDDIFQLFLEADKNFHQVPCNFYLYRQLGEYQSFFNSHAKRFSTVQRGTCQKKIQRMINRIKEEDDAYNTRKIQEELQEVIIILNEMS